jgi:hypothetical protein
MLLSVSSYPDTDPRPNMLGRAFLPTRPAPFSTLGTPEIILGSRIRVWSNFAGMRTMILRYSPLKLPVGLGTAALRHK